MWSGNLTIRRVIAIKKAGMTMSLPSLYPQASATQLPVAIDYPAALALRQMAAQHDEYPQYLLAPEVSALLHYVPFLHRKMLLPPSGIRARTLTKRWR